MDPADIMTPASPSGLSRRAWLALCLSVVALLALRVPFLPPTLDDLDSVNFDLGVHAFDPVSHRPHPPGYAVYIAAAKLVHPFFSSHAAGLAFVSALFGALALVPLFILLRTLSSPAAAGLATVLVCFNPLLWFSSVRPMSDVMGLFAALAAQALLVVALQHRAADTEGARRLWTLGVVVAGLALGVRVQAAVLVGPILVHGWWRWRALRLATLAWFATGVAAWLVPAAVWSGGPLRLGRAFVELINDALPVEPLVGRFTLERAIWAARYSFVTPWGPPWLGTVVVILAGLGAFALLVKDRRRLILILLLFLPYAVFHYLLQMTEVLRYAVPIVPMVAVLAAEPLVRWRKEIGLPLPVAAVAFIAVSSYSTAPALAAYSSTPSPPARAMARLGEIATRSPNYILSGNYVFTRYFPWLPTGLEVLPPTPRTEWRQLATYWKNGGRQPILFLRDASRTSLRLVGARSQTPLEQWNWPASVAQFIGGDRPGHIELVRIDPPRWFAESGFLLTFEAGPIARVAREPHRMFVWPDDTLEALTVAGSVVGAGGAEVRVRVGDREVDRWQLSGAFTARAKLAALPPGAYVPVILETSTPVLFTDVLVERSNLTAVQPVTGFFLPERDERAAMFRWMAPEATAVVVVKNERARLRLRGLVPVEHYREPVTVSLSLDDHPLVTRVVHSKEFVIERELPAAVAGGPRTLRLKASHHFVPDPLERNGDARRLALRVYELTVEPLEGNAAQSTTDAMATTNSTFDAADPDPASRAR